MMYSRPDVFGTSRPSLIRSDSYTAIRQSGRITPILRPASTGHVPRKRGVIVSNPSVQYAADILVPRNLVRKRPTSTLLTLGDLPSQTIELSSDSSLSSAHSRPPSPIRHRATRRVPRSYREVRYVPPPREDSPVSMPDEPTLSPYRGLRRVQSDRFDQVAFERRIAIEGREAGCLAYGSSVDGSSELMSWSSRTQARERAGLLDEEQRTNRRIIDRSALIDELFRTSNPPRTNYKARSHALPRQPAVHHIHRASRAPTLPTIASGRMLQPKIPRNRDPSTPERHHRYSSFTPQTPSDTPPSHRLMTPSSSDTLHEVDSGRCDACGRDQNQGRKMRMMPCAHIVCSTCFSSSISAVSVTLGPSRCTTCLEPVISFEPVKTFRIVNSDEDEVEDPRPSIPDCAGMADIDQKELPVDDQTAVLRIDNVAWDVTPAVVEGFLPPDVLPPDHPSPVHILLDRMDGRTKDFLYIEVKSLEAARHILKTRQNTLMPCGSNSMGRKRFVTISLTTHKELLDELRPKTSAELHSLLKLCQASIVSTHPATSAQGSYVGYNGIAHFVKDRHGPFYALMSILCHLSGKNSPAYWDLFHVTSGALAALASVISTRHQYIKNERGIIDLNLQKTIQGDQELLDKLRYLFQTRFISLTPVSSPS